MLAAGKVFLQRTTLCGVHPFREMLTEVRGHLFAFDLLALHAFMYPWSCSRRNIRARRSRDFTAGIDRRRIFAVSSALFPSISQDEDDAVFHGQALNRPVKSLPEFPTHDAIQGRFLPGWNGLNYRPFFISQRIVSETLGLIDRQ